MLELLRSSVDDHGQTVVIVTHDPVAAAYTDRVVFLADGRIVEELRNPDRERRPRGDGPDGRPRRGEGLSMIRAALKSLLGRKVRLLLSTFAIVLGVAFVAGSLIFSDTLSRSFTALFASTVGDVVVRPRAATDGAGRPSSLTVPATCSTTSSRSTARPASTATSTPFGVYVVGADGKLVGGPGPARRSAATGPTRPPATASRASRSSRRRPPRAGRGRARRAHRRAGGLRGRRHGRRSSRPGAEPRLAADAGRDRRLPGGGSLNGATLTLFDTATAQELFLEGEDVYTDVWVTAEDGVSQEELARRRRARSCPTTSRRSPATRRPTSRASDAAGGDLASSPRSC